MFTCAYQHKLGADGPETFPATRVDPNNRLRGLERERDIRVRGCSPL